MKNFLLKTKTIKIISIICSAFVIIITIIDITHSLVKTKLKMNQNENFPKLTNYELPMTIKIFAQQTEFYFFI